MKFEDFDEEFEFEKVKKRSLVVKVRTATFFLVFLLIIIGLAKNDFNFNFSDKEKIEFVCGTANTKSAIDDRDLWLEKAKRALISNKEIIKRIPFFVKAEVVNKEIGARGLKIPIIRIIFSEESKEQKKIPKEICNFEIEKIYK